MEKNLKRKFLRQVDYKGPVKSEYGTCKWKIGELKKETDISLCNKGFHCSDSIYEAFSYVQGEILALVEVGGKEDKKEDKSTHEEMKIIKAYKWQKKDSVALAIYSAELCISSFEKEFPNDNRPRQAIEAAKVYLANPCQQTIDFCRSAARSARSAAESAWSARSAWSAWSAAESAWSARSARSAARSARSAAESAWSAANIKKQLINKMQDMVKDLEEVKF